MKPVHILSAFFLMLSYSSCHKKGNPAKQQAGADAENPSVKKASTTNPAVRQIRTPVPKVITVNDNAAKKTFDGRLYYDLEGHRYWRNYRDGKYYLYHVSMNTNPDFKKP